MEEARKYQEETLQTKQENHSLPKKIQAGRHSWFYNSSRQSEPSHMTLHDSNTFGQGGHEFYAFYAFYVWWIYFPQLGALTEGTSWPVSHKHDQA
jgi:hypothetical protein